MERRIKTTAASGAKAAFDPKQLKAEVEKLIVNQGPRRGENFKVLPWQMEMFKAMSVHREVALTISRSNGKSTVVAAIACSAISPEGCLFVPRGEVVLTAASMNQAKIAFDHIVEFMRPLLYTVDEDGDAKLNRKVWTLNESTHLCRILHKPTRTVLKIIGSDPKKAHGLAGSLYIADEPAQWESGGDMHYAALRTSLGKQANPRMLLIGTRPRSPLHFFSRLLSNPPPGTASIVYAATPKDCEDGGAYLIRTIKKANPSYNHLAALRSELKEFRDGAKRLGGIRRAQYLALYLNMGTSESDAIEDVIEAEAWAAVTKRKQPERQGPVAVGVDLGGGNSLSAVAFYWHETGRIEAHGALPEFPSLEERGQADGIGMAYEEMVEAGVLHIHGRKETKNAEFLEERFSHVTGFPILGVACDRYKKTAVLQAMVEAEVDDDLLVDRAVGKGADGWGDLEAFRSAVLEEHVKPGVNLALEHALMTARVKRDNNGNASLDKSTQRGRIDVLQAVIHAVGLGERVRRPPEKKRPFDVGLFFSTGGYLP